MTTFNAILEVERHANGGKHDTQRYLDALRDLRQSSIKSHVIFDVITQYNDKPVVINHFGYNYKCQEFCNHDKQAYGVNRYFGITLVIQGYDNPNCNYFLYGDYQINPYSRICICGSIIPYNGVRTELHVIGD